MAVIRLTNGDDTYRDTPAGNTIFARGGGDRVIGNGGEDVIFGQPGNDRISLIERNSDEYLAGRAYGGEGNDTINARYFNLTIGGGEGDDRLTTNSYDGTTRGGPGDDIIDTRGVGVTAFGGAGDDDILASGAYGFARGGDGDDDLAVYAGNSGEARGGNGDDRLSTSLSSYNIGMYGGAGDDVIIYGETVTGGRGEDLMLSNGDARFVFDDLDSAVGLRSDQIRSFAPAEDRLDLRRIDGDAARPGDQALLFIEGSEFSAPGQVREEFGLVQINTDADRAAEAEIDVRLTGGSLGADNFLL